jgi:hypothetical protein
MWIPASAMTPISGTYVLGAGASWSEVGTLWNKARTLDFDQTTDEGAIFTVAMPKSWDRGTFTFKAYWQTTAASGAAVWRLYGVANENGETWTATSNLAEVVSTTAGANTLTVTSESSTLTPIGVTTTENQLLTFLTYRHASNASDTLAADAKLIGYLIFFTTDKANDA